MQNLFTRFFPGHPVGLSTLFFTEMWERLSYYGMRALLILYMTAAVAGENPGMGLDAETAGAIYGLYTGFVYLLALPGGWIADRLIGQRRAVLIGGIIIAAGHFSMAIESTASFFGGLILIVIGTGLLKPNVSAIVGDLYPMAEDGDETPAEERSRLAARRDAGFSVFYSGINIGAFAGPLICGGLGQGFEIAFLGISVEGNWHYGFAAAGVGMVLGLIQYVLGTRHLQGAGELSEAQTTPAELTKAKRMIVNVTLVVGVLAAAAWGLSLAGTYTLTLKNVAYGLGVSMGLLGLGYILGIALFGGLTGPEKKRMAVIAVLFVGAALFWSGFEQAGSSLNLFAEHNTDNNVLGWDVPASYYQSINPLFIILLAPLFGYLWIWLGKRQPSTPAKFALGLIQLGAGFAVIAWGAMQAQQGNLVSPMWLVVTYFLHTTGELCLSPVGLSSMTKLAPRRYVGQMMGIWFMGTALGNLVGGLIGGQFENLPLPQLFGSVAMTTAGFGVVMLMISPFVKKLMGGVE